MSLRTINLYLASYWVSVYILGLYRYQYDIGIWIQYLQYWYWHVSMLDFDNHDLMHRRKYVCVLLLGK